MFCMQMNHITGCTTTHLSAILADFILSITMTCLLQHIEVDSATPRADPAVLVTSTSSGPEAVVTESVKANGSPS